MRILFHIAALLPGALFAQTWDEGVSAALDTTALRIGEQVTLTLSVQYRGGGATPSIAWPVIGDTLNQHIEVVKDSGVDTLLVREVENGFIQRRALHLTSFDTGYWAIPAFRFHMNGAQLESKPMLLHVQGVQLDSTLAARDIKGIHELPFSFTYWLREHATWVVGGAAVVALAALILWLVLRKRKEGPAAEAPPIYVPVHQRTIDALNALEKQRLWQNGEHKAYHSRITDLLRAYIEERYRVPAMESTTDELLQELRVSALSLDQRGQLGNMLRLADMVKFAKALPSPIENEQMMTGALRFVQETADIPTPAAHAS
ncbi:MAG: hypothetical protein ABI432_19785 [Flavobacteriales bacterium]